jgi:DnaJ-class molecular chaperone with C-terminal Zn finger domain
MPSSARPDLFAFMDAYKVLAVDYTADSASIRRAHKRLAKQHHPDRFPAGSAEQQQATARMAEINDAYRLIREAPLRYHRVSKASDPTTPWTDTELDDAIRRARMNQVVDRSTTIALIAVAAIAVPLFASTVAVFKALPLTAAVVLGWTVMLWTFLVWRRVQGIW